MAGKLVCLCNLIDDSEIRYYLKKGAKSTSDIQSFTRAGTTCGRCLPEIDQMVSDYQKEKPKGQQKKLDFGF